jgi:hypothetical protein
MMKKSLLTILMVLVLSSGVALAQTQANAPANVYIVVQPNIGVSFVGSGDMGTVAAIGPFSRPLAFSVDANKQEVNLWVQVTELYKDNLPLITTFKSIKIEQPAGVLVVPTNASRLPPGTPNIALPYVGTAPADTGAGFLGLTTAEGHFGSGLATFSTTVTVTPTWNLNSETVVGTYGGKVTLYAMVL